MTGGGSRIGQRKASECDADLTFMMKGKSGQQERESLRS